MFDTKHSKSVQNKAIQEWHLNVSENIDWEYMNILTKHRNNLGLLRTEKLTSELSSQI